MKTQTIKTYANTKVSGYIEEQNVLGSNKAKHSATNLGLSDKILLSGGSLRLFTESILHHYNGILAGINEMLNSTMHSKARDSEQANSLVDDRAFRQKIADKEVFNTGTSAKGNFSSILLVLFKFLFISGICVAILCGDWLYLSYSLQVWVENMLIALCLGFAVSFGSMALAHFGEVWISTKVKSLKTRNILRWFIAFLILTVFVGIGIARQQYVLLTTNTYTPVSVFLGINIFLFLATFVILETSLKPMLPEIKEVFRLFFQNLRDRKRTKSINKLNALRDANQTKLRESIEEKDNIISFHEISEDKIMQHYLEAVGIFKTEIINNCEVLPSWLNDEIPALTFFTSKNKKYIL